MILDHTKILETALETGTFLKMSASTRSRPERRGTRVVRAPRELERPCVRRELPFFNITDHSNDIEALRHVTGLRREWSQRRDLIAARRPATTHVPGRDRHVSADGLEMGPTIESVSRLSSARFSRADRNDIAGTEGGCDTGARGSIVKSCAHAVAEQASLWRRMLGPIVRTERRSWSEGGSTIERGSPS